MPLDIRGMNVLRIQNCVNRTYVINNNAGNIKMLVGNKNCKVKLKESECCCGIQIQ